MTPAPTNRLSKTLNNSTTINYQLGLGNRLASTSAQAATNTLFVSGSANELIGTDERWGEIWITNLTSGAGGFPSVNGCSFFAELPVLAGQTNTLHVAIPDRAGNMGYATTDIYAPTAGGMPSSASYTYDAAGCLTNLNGVSLDWDERYRLTSAVRDSVFDIQYSYDVLGRRVSRIEGSTTNYFIYNGNQVVADLDGSGTLIRSYVWGPGIDNLLALTVYGVQTNTYYAIKDHQNSVIALVDETGVVVESYEYSAYGETKGFDLSGIELAESAIGNRYTFQGREIDWETGLYYFRARWYDPETGRWLSKDPVGIAGGFNLYDFCDNNPVNFVDPMGLETHWEWDFSWASAIGDGLSQAADDMNQVGFDQMDAGAEALGNAWDAHQSFHDSIREGASQLEGGHMAAFEVMGLGGLLARGGLAAMAEGGVGTVAGGGWVILGGEIIWIGVDIFQGIRDGNNPCPE